MAGPIGPGLGATPSPGVATWKFSATGVARALAPAWAASTSVGAGDALVATGADGVRRLYVYPSSTTTGATAPSFSGVGTDGTQSNVVGYPLPFSNGMAVTNEDPTSTNIVRGGDKNAQNAGIGPNFGSEPIPMADPSAYYVVSTGGATSPVSVRAFL